MKLIKFILIIILAHFTFFGLTAQDTTLSNDAAQTVADTSKNIVESSQQLLKDTVDQLKSPPVENLISFSNIFWSLVLILIAYVLIWIITRLLNRMAESSTRYRISIKRTIPIVKIVGWILVIYIIMEGIINPPLATIIAFFTSIGVAIAISAQDMLKNFFGGFVILFDRPFQLGDKIESGNHYGEVIKIGLQSTRIVTADDSTVTIPNSEVINQYVSNSNSGEANCQVVAEFYLPEDIEIDKVRKIALEAARVSKYVFLNKPIMVTFSHEAKEHRTYLKMRLKAYVSDIRFEFAFKSDMTEIVIRELFKAGILSKPEKSDP